MARKRKSQARSWWSFFLLLVVIANATLMIVATIQVPH
jgi:hypothetical protein